MKFHILKKLRTSLAITFCLFVSTSVFCQSPYNVNFQNELKYIFGGGAGMGLASYLHAQTRVLTTNDLYDLEWDDIPGIDRFAVYNSNSGDDLLSDHFFRGSFLLSALFLSDKKMRSDFGKIAFLYGETALISGAVTNLSKSLFQRPRPYVFNEYVSNDVKFSRNARASFMSGHTSMTATNTVFFAKVFSDYYPDSKLKPYVWGLALAIPAYVGYLRVNSGNHYPTDVAAGFLVGGAIGFLVPHLHRADWMRKHKMEIGGGASGASLTITF